MPLYDYECPACGFTELDVYESFDVPVRVCTCGGTTQRKLMTGKRAVVGDEIDVEIKNGLCWPDGTPRRFRSRAELKRVEQASSLINYVEHIDGSKTTSRWGALPTPEEDRLKQWHEHEQQFTR